MLKLIQAPGDKNIFKAPADVLLTSLVHNDQSDTVDAATFELATGSKCRLVLGRGSATLPVDVEINAKRDTKEIISRQHAEVFATASGRHVIRDMKSLNGVFVNNLCIDEHELKEGDLIQFGGVAKVPVGHMISSTDVCLKYVYISSSNKDFSNLVSKHIQSMQGVASSHRAALSLSPENRAFVQIHVSERQQQQQQQIGMIPELTATASSSSSSLPSESTPGLKRATNPSATTPKTNDFSGDLGPSNRIVDNNDGIYYKFDSNSPIVPKKNGNNNSIISSSNSCSRNSSSNDGISSSNISSNSSSNSGSNGNGDIIKPKSNRGRKKKVRTEVATSILYAQVSSQSDQLIKSRTETLRRITGMEEKITSLQMQNKTLVEENSTLQTISSAQVSLIQQHMNQLEILKKSNDSALESKTKLEVSLYNKQQELADQMEENFKLKKAGTSGNSSSSSSSTITRIDQSSLRASLCCALCSEPLLDAAVLSCTHGFCMCCIEAHWEWHTDFIMSRGSKPLAQSSVTKDKTLCPSCNSTFPVFNKESIIHASTLTISSRENDPLKAAEGIERLKHAIRKWRLDRGLYYHRSSHIDNLVWLYIESSLKDEQDLFKTREREHAEKLRRLKLSSMPKKPIEAGRRLLHDDSDASDDSDDDRSESGSKDDDDDANNKNGNSNNSNRQRKKYKASSSGKGCDQDLPICGYCLEKGHEDHQCPYDANNM